MTIKTSSYRQSLLTALLDPAEASAYLKPPSKTPRKPS